MKHDLWEFTTPQLGKLQIPDNPHFTAKGSEALATQIAKSIRAALAGETAATKR